MKLSSPHQWMILAADREACPACMWAEFRGLAQSAGVGEYIEDPVSWQLAVIVRWLASPWMHCVLRAPLYLIAVFALWLAADKHLDEDPNRQKLRAVAPAPDWPPPIVLPDLDAPTAVVPSEPDIDELLDPLCRYGAQNPDWLKRFAERFADRYDDIVDVKKDPA